MMVENHNLQQVKAYCTKKGIKLTTLRLELLKLICNSPQPLGAYDLLRELRKIRSNAEPPTVYRVLEFLQTQNLIHRIDSNNTYLSCIHPETPHQSQLLICKSCGTTLEIEDKSIIQAIKKSAEATGFMLTNDLIELRGLCARCQPKKSL